MNATRIAREHDEEPRPQLTQVLDERRLLAVAEPTRGEPHVGAESSEVSAAGSS